MQSGFYKRIPLSSHGIKLHYIMQKSELNCGMRGLFIERHTILVCQTVPVSYETYLTVIVRDDFRLKFFVPIWTLCKLARPPP